jgi:hypothetical protein
MTRMPERARYSPRIGAPSIKLYEKQIAQARSDLAHVTAAIRIFEASGKPSDSPLICAI